MPTLEKVALAPVAENWLGIDPDQLVVSLHRGPGWGSAELTGRGEERRLRVSVPAGWLASVWACGLALVGRHLVLREADGSVSVHPAVRDYFAQVASATEQGFWHHLIGEQLISLVARPGFRLLYDSRHKESTTVTAAAPSMTSSRASSSVGGVVICLKKAFGALGYCR